MKKGDIFLVNFEPSIGSEFKKTRPAIVLQSSEINSKLLTVMPISTNKNEEKLGENILIKRKKENRLFADSVIKVNQISSFDKRRFIHFIGRADRVIMNKIDKYLSRHFSLLLRDKG